MSTTAATPPLNPALPSSPEVIFPTARTTVQRLLSLDVFRGLVILAMLLVNNIGDASAVGFFWSHADWKPVSLAADFRAWFANPDPRHFPLFHHCTLADFVMPMFMLIIGIAIPFSVASATRRGISTQSQLWKAVRRGATLYALGWLIDASLTLLYWLNRTDPAQPLRFTLGMNVLQLLGVGYVLARLVYLLPLTARLVVAAALFAWHLALLKYLPQGPIPAGTFTAKNNAVGYLYSTLWIFQGFKLTPFLTLSFAGMLSAPPAAATMLLGTYLGDTLNQTSPSRPDGFAGSLASRSSPTRKLLLFAATTLTLGILLSFILPMNKPRWTPGYLFYCAGVGTLLITSLHHLIDSHRPSYLVHRTFLLPLIALGTNAIGIYVLSILFKIWFLNLPGFTPKLISFFQTHAGRGPGSWLFTLSFLTLVWLSAAFAYRRNWIWKV